MHLEHIDPQGGNQLDNLCLACPSCNLSKAKATSAIDPETGQTVPLFNPRQQIWHEHFKWDDDGVMILAKTPVGRATAVRLKLNIDRVVTARKVWVKAGEHPPK